MPTIRALNYIKEAIRAYNGSEWEKRQLVESYDKIVTTIIRDVTEYPIEDSKEEQKILELTLDLLNVARTNEDIDDIITTLQLAKHQGE